MSTVADECGELTSCTKKLSQEKRLERLRNISNLLNETVKRGEEKFALAKSTYDTVCTHYIYATVRCPRPMVIYICVSTD
jgi:hypothetical protein